MDRIGQIEYDKNEVLGEGQFAMVFRGTFHGGDGKLVAVKRIEHHNISTVFERAVNALKELKDHPNIISFYCSEEDANFRYFALELCAASMDDIFLPDDNPKKYKGPLPSDLDVLLQLSKGLQYIHEKGFVHGNIKPENVLISYPKDDGTVVMKWADFGLSILRPNNKALKTIESDIWSAGCVFFKYLTRGGDFFFGSRDYAMRRLPENHFATNIIGEMIQKEPKNRMKLADVLEILEMKKIDQQKRDDHLIRRRLLAGQLYSWEQWNLFLTQQGGELFVWSDDVVIQDPMKWLRSTEAQTGRDKRDLNSREMPQMLGIKPDTPRQSPLNTYFVSDGVEWTVWQSETGDTLRIIKGENLTFVPFQRAWNVELVLFGPSFLSTFHTISEHVVKCVHMTTNARLAMERELLDLCSRPCPEQKELDRIAQLLHVGINPNKIETDAGQTPLLLSLKNQNGKSRLKCLKTLLKDNKSRHDFYPPIKVNLNARDSEGRNVFQLLFNDEEASCSDPRVYETLKLLVQSGMDVKWKDQDERTVLHYLCGRHYESENIADAIRFLTNNGADVYSKDKYERNVLHYLCENYRNKNIVEAMRLLMIKGVDVNWTDQWGHTALHFLCSHYQNENIVAAMRLLIIKGVDVNWTDRWGHTALHLLCSRYQNENIVDAMKLLIVNGIDVKRVDEIGRTALHYLCQNYKNENIVDAMKLLIDNGVDVNSVDDSERTALHLLCENYKKYNLFEAICLFTQKGVDLNLQDKNGKKALGYLNEDQLT